MSLVSRSACVSGNVPDRPTVSIRGLYEHAVSEINMVMIVIVLVIVFSLHCFFNGTRISLLWTSAPGALLFSIHNNST